MCKDLFFSAHDPATEFLVNKTIMQRKTRKITCPNVGRTDMGLHGMSKHITDC